MEDIAPYFLSSGISEFLASHFNMTKPMVRNKIIEAFESLIESCLVVDESIIGENIDLL